MLKDGSDSVVVLGALNRVYVNIGLYSEEWLRHFNALFGGEKTSPFEISVARQNSTVVDHLKSSFSELLPA